MNDSPLVLRLVGGDPAAPREVLAALPTSTAVDVLVAGSVLTGSATVLVRARGLATVPRERQLVALAQARQGGRTDLFDALVRDHLATYPDHVLAAWIAARTTHASGRNPS